MGSGLVDFPEYENEGDAQAVSYTEIFERQFPYYLSLGMSYEDYWFGDNKLPIFYKQSSDIKARRRNNEDHRLGLYIREAVASLLSDKSEYPELPYPLTEEEKEEQDLYIRKRKYEYMKARLHAQAKEHKGNLE